MRWAIFSPWAINDDSIGGTERFIKDLTGILDKLKQKIDVFMLSGKTHNKNGIRFISLNAFGDDVVGDEYMLSNLFGDLSDKNTYTKIAKFIEGKVNYTNYDIMQFNSPLFLRCFQDKKRILTLHSNYREVLVSGKDRDFWTQVELMNEQKKNNIIYVVPSQSYFNYWKKLIGEKVCSIPHAINFVNFYCDSKKEIIAKKYDINISKKIFLLPSRLEPIQKRPQYFLQACTKLKNEEKQKMQIVFTGIDIQYEKFVKKLKTTAEKNDLNVKFINFDDIKEGYKVADFVVIPSRSESFGYAGLEGLALGKMTILSKLPTFKEISAGNTNALLFKNKDELKNIITKVLNEKPIEHKIPDQWLQKYDINKWGKKYVELAFNLNKLPEIEDVIFDLDGTLWDSCAGVAQAWTKVAGMLGYSIKFLTDDIKNFMGLSGSEIKKILKRDFKITDEKFFQECVKEEVNTLCKENTQLYKNVEETLSILKQNNKRLFIVSNCQEGYIEKFLQIYNLKKYFNDFLCSGNVFKNKTCALSFLKDKYQIEKFIYVGDLEKDFDACFNNGGDFVFAAYGFGKDNNYLNKIDKILQLPKLLINITSNLAR